MSGTVLRVAAWVLAVGLVIAPIVAVVNGWVGAERWPLRTLRVNGELQQVDAAKLRETLLPHAQRGFFAVRLDEAQAAVSALPWVASAVVRKRWPDTLEVSVVEHRPIARWGDDRLLSDDGTLFPAGGTAAPATLPLLDGPDARTDAVIELYGEVRALFVPAGIDVQALRLDRRGSWTLQLSNGVDVAVGSREARLRLDRFAGIMPRLLAQQAGAARARPLLRADLRYTNGFALTWGEPAAP